jgi:putative spermidine/putrescine transport system substrate-binding protein
VLVRFDLRTAAVGSATTHARLPRRLFIAASAAMAAVRASAAEQCIISTQGGDYAHLLHEIIDAPLVVPQGIGVIQDVADEPTRAAKIYAGRVLPRGTIDVSSNSAAVNHKLADAGLLQSLTTQTVPNLAHILPRFRSPFIAPQFYSPQVLVYNPELVHPAPHSFADLLDPRWHGKIGFPNLSYFNVLLAASLYDRGTPNQIERAKPLIERLNANGLRLYPQVDSMAAAFSSGEIVLGIMGMSRVVMWQNAGIGIASAFPDEGCIVYISGMVIPRNAPNKSAAYRYLNAMLEPSAQVGFAAKMGYLPAVDNAPLSGRTAQQLDLPNPGPRLFEPDYAYTTRIQAEISEWWTKLTMRG